MSLPGWLADPALARMWEELHGRLERHGPSWRGRVTLTGLDSAPQRAVSALLGKTVLRSSVTIDLIDLDDRLANAGGLLAAVQAATGRPVLDRSSERERATIRREAPVAAARALLPDAPWGPDWLAELRRLSPQVDVAESAARVLVALHADRPLSRVDLAAEVLGDAHGLDDDAPATSLVLRGLAHRFETEFPSAAEGRRELWRLAGVSGDEISSTCLVLRLPLLSGKLAHRVSDGDPVHITRRDLTRYALEVPSAARVLVVENPRVLEAVAEAELDVAVVCVNGNPHLVTLELLRALARCEAVLDYHGDFDWAGLGITNRLIGLVGVRPWAMSAADYLAAPGGVPLRGPDAEASWDPQLTPAMRARGKAVHEEAVLPDLLDRLRHPQDADGKRRVSGEQAPVFPPGEPPRPVAGPR